MNLNTQSKDENKKDTEGEVEAQEPAEETRVVNETATKAEEVIDVLM